MAIKIRRKRNTNITWECNTLFSMAFPPEQAVFEIPKLEYMLYLYKNFDLIEATDEFGEDLDITHICNCCRESVRLELLKEAEREKEEENVVEL